MAQEEGPGNGDGEGAADAEAPTQGTRVITRKTLIGVLAAHDSNLANTTLVSLFTHIYRHGSTRERLEGYHLVVTGGTYDRLFFGGASVGGSKLFGLAEEVAAWLRGRCGVTRLPAGKDGGVIVLAHMITQQRCSIIAPFFAAEHHWLRPENLALMRLCDQWRVKRLMNAGSVLTWFEHEALLDRERNLQVIPPVLELRTGLRPVGTKGSQTRWKLRSSVTAAADVEWKTAARQFNAMSIALIAHDEMKGRMIEFAIDHEAELGRFGAILATGTTGREVAAATSHLYRKIVRYHSGPKGGDIEISSEIIFGFCDIVIFFVDPLRSHPHIEDIRTVFQTCIERNDVLMITNEMHAREFMSRVVRGDRDGIATYRKSGV